jgi:cell division protein FtsQ
MRPLIISPEDRPAPPRSRAGARAPSRSKPPGAGRWRRFKLSLVPSGAGIRVGVAALILALAAAAFSLARAGAFDRALERAILALARATAEGGLSVQAIDVSGRQRLAAETLRRAIDVPPGAPILFVDIEQVRQRVESLGWVEQAVVERRLPQTIAVSVRERVPFALWQRDGVNVVIDARGVTIHGADAGQYRHLPRVVGPGAAPAAAALFAALAEDPDLHRWVSNAVRVRERRWDLELVNGVTVRLQEEDVAAAWRRLGDIERAQRLLERDIVAIDLRFADRLVVQLNPAAAQARRLPGKDT